jgi:hypothetical protein
MGNPKGKVRGQWRNQTLVSEWKGISFPVTVQTTYNFNILRVPPPIPVPTLTVHSSYLFVFQYRFTRYSLWWLCASHRMKIDFRVSPRVITSTPQSAQQHRASKKGRGERLETREGVDRRTWCETGLSALQHNRILKILACVWHVQEMDVMQVRRLSGLIIWFNNTPGTSAL